jgi:hypothetical protein
MTPARQSRHPREDVMTVGLWLRAFIAVGLVTMLVAVMAAAALDLNVYIVWSVLWGTTTIYAAAAEARRRTK